MVKILLFWFLLISVFTSCSTQQEQVVNSSSEQVSVPMENTGSHTPDYSVKLFLVDSLNPKLGFGYSILIDGTLFIHQSSIPSVAGNKAFETKEQAEAVANLVALKLKNNIMPPSVSKNELDSLKILAP